VNVVRGSGMPKTLFIPVQDLFGHPRDRSGSGTDGKQAEVTRSNILSPSLAFNLVFRSLIAVPTYRASFCLR